MDVTDIMDNSTNKYTNTNTNIEVENIKGKSKSKTEETPEEIESKRKSDFRLSDRGEFSLNLYKEKLIEYNKDLDKEKNKEEHLKLDVFEAIVNAEELNNYQQKKTMIENIDDIMSKDDDNEE